MTPRLIHLNGPPGSGKSTVAVALAASWPLLLVVVEIDELRTRIGGWESDDRSKLLARDLAVAMIERHLGGGHDVIVPQYLGRPEFVERLASVAVDHGADFHEIVLEVDADVAVERFRARRAGLIADGVSHPERDVADHDVASTIDEAIAHLARIEITGVQPVRVSAATVDETVAAVRRAIAR